MRTAKGRIPAGEERRANKTRGLPPPSIADKFSPLRGWAHYVP